jgi:hypothetical protein
MGGAVLLVVMILALVGCGSPVGGKPDAPGPAVTKVALGEGKLAVTFNRTLAEIDKDKGEKYTTTPTNYEVHKSVSGSPVKQTIASATPGADANTVILAIAGIDADFKNAAPITVTVVGVGKMDYVPAAKPERLSVTATAAAKIKIVFNDGVKVPTDAGSQFTVKGVNFAAPTATVDQKDPRAVLLTVVQGEITEATKDITISYAPVEGKNLTTIADIDIGGFTDIPVTVAFESDTGGGDDNPKPLTASAPDTTGPTNGAGNLTLTFTEDLYTAKETKVTGGLDVKNYFQIQDAGADPTKAFAIATAVVDTTALNVVIFTFTNTGDGDKVEPKSTGTLMSSSGTPWAQSVSYTVGTTTWAVK